MCLLMQTFFHGLRIIQETFTACQALLCLYLLVLAYMISVVLQTIIMDNNQVCKTIHQVEHYNRQ